MYVDTTFTVNGLCELLKKKELLNEGDKGKLGIKLLKLKSKKRIKLTFDNCYQFLLSLAFYDTKKEKNRERLINALVKNVYVIGNRI